MMQDKADKMEMASMILFGCLAGLILATIIGVFGGWLLTIVAGYFGYELTLWQGMVTAFTVRMLLSPTVTTSK